MGFKDTPDSYGNYVAPHSYNNKFIDCEFHGGGMEGFYVSHYAYNTEFTNCMAYCNDYFSEWTSGFAVRDGAHDNVFTNCRAAGFLEGICLQDTMESRTGVLDPPDYTNIMTVQSNNTFSNCIIEDSTGPAILLGSTDNNMFKNCVFARNIDLLAVDNVNQDNILRNSIVIDSYHYEIDWHDEDSEPDINPYDNICITYSDFWNNEFLTPYGNMEEDPLFADALNSDYHLKSQFGRWNGSSWVQDTATSPCIDSGDPTDDYSNEPIPNGHVINMGAYGNTDKASKSSILGKWHFDEASGLTATDASGNANTGILAGMTSPDCWVNGVSGNGLQFDGTDDEVNCGNNEGLNMANGQVTISVWVKPANLPTTTSILGKWQSGTGGYSLATVNDDVILFVHDVSHILYAYNVLAVDTWTHVVYTIDNTVSGTIVLKSYINGVFRSERTYTDGVNVGTTTNNFYVGAQGRYGTRFSGVIDEPAIYGQVLNLGEVSQQYLDEVTSGKWHFDEVSGLTATDASGNANTGILAGMTSPDCWVNGVSGNGLQFDGTDDEVNCGNNEGLNMANGQVTISVWVKPANLPTTTSILGKWQSGTGGYSLATVNDDVILFVHDVSHILYAYNVLAVDTWTHVVYTIDNTVSGTIVLKSYINGRFRSERTYTDGVNVGTTTNNFYVGAQGRYGTRFSGVIDEPAIYGRVLSFSEIYRQHLDEITNGKWHFDETSGLTATDSSGNANPGTLAGMTSPDCWVNGISGNGLQFDGTDDEVNCGNNGVLNIANGRITISVWVKPASLPTTTSILGKWQSGTGGYSLATVNDDVILFIHDVSHILYAYNVLAVDTWTHVVYTIDNTVSGTIVLKSYINGVFRSERTYTDGVNVGTTTNNFYIGAQGRYGTRFSGVIDEPAIYDQVLGLSEIYQLWQERQ
ncbi:MAG: hypothetical protein PHT33_01085 [bacterium]|nr:hypothetical protein [bacterium]